MTLLGLDFDNTLVRYDKLFHQIAVEKGLIDRKLPATKNAVKKELLKKDKEKEFTSIQGEVYGARIKEAMPAEGMVDAILRLKEKGVKMIIVSHKTKTPYIGPKYNLHQAAISWLNKWDFFDENGLGWSKEDIFFESTKEKKVERIIKTGCTHFVDDLPSILEMLKGKSIKRIFYSPENQSNNIENNVDCTIKRWSEIHNEIK